MTQLSGTASAEIDAPLQRVWECVADVLSAPTWQGGMDSIRALETDAQGRALVAETETDAGVRTVRTRVRFAYEPPHRLSWRQEKGDLKSVEGSWTLEDLGAGRTRATYALDGDPGRVLGMLLRGPVADRVRSLLVDNRPSELKAHLEAG